MENTVHVLGVVVAGVMLVMAAAMWLHERGLFEAMARFLPRSVAERLLLAAVVVGFIHYGATKETNGVRGVSSPMRTVTQTPDFVLDSICTNKTFDFSAPFNAVIAEKWRRRGAAHDRFSLSPEGWTFPVGDISVTNLAIFSEGKVRLPDDTEVSPLPATHGIVPEGNWTLLAESNRPSLFWHSLSDDGSLLLTWQNVLLHRAATNPVSFQAELKPSGSATFRYDLSRLASDGPLDGIVPSAGKDELAAFAAGPLARETTSIAFKSRKEANCDGFRAGFDESLGDQNPFSFPEGSTNTVLEHLFYSGTTNGAFFYPQTNDGFAVLRIAVSGSGSGDLLVGGSYVPLVAPPQMRGSPQGSPLMLSVPKGRTVPLYLRGDGTLSVSFDSDGFAFGELPSIAANRCAGWINFPVTKATEPCIHDLGRKTKGVTLPASGDADGLACTWQGGTDVEVENHPPRSATLTATFDPKGTGGMTYTLSHPKYLFGQTGYAQTVRYCPRPDDDEPPFPDEGEENDDDDDDYWCSCCGWSCVACACPVSCECICCDHGICPEHSVPYEECANLHDDDYEDAATNAVATLSGVLYIRNPPVVGDHISLEVPPGRVNCCPCPDHWTNYVGVAYKSCRLRVTDQSGSPFSISETSCTVDIAGVAPSEAVGDAELAFARNGNIYGRRGYTVLGVGIRRDGVPLSRYNDLAPSFGFPMAVCTNQWEAPELRLVTNVRLPVGRVRVELEGGAGQFAVWCRSGGGWLRLAGGEEAASDIPIAAWRTIMRGADGWDDELPVRVTASAPGSARLVLRYWAVIDGAFVEDAAEQRITALCPMMADIDGDRSLGDGDMASHLAGRVFRFWTNEDCHKGDYVGQSSDLAPNASDLVVNGRLDLVNLFPVKLDLKPFIDAWGNAAKFVLWSPAGNALRFCGLDARPSEAWAYQTNDVCTTAGGPVHAAGLTPVGGEGAELDTSVCLGSGNAPGVLAFEAAGEVLHSDALTLLVMDGDDMLFSCSIPLVISPARSMYRWLNIRYAAGGAGGEASALGEPWNRPDEECDGRHFVFVHGYNVNPAAARQWADAMFKRLWLTGSRSMFTAVDWYGDDSQFATLMHGDVSPDYYANVMHAFASAPAFASHVASLPGTEKVMLAHSLGNMLVSSAAVDHNLQYSRYYMLNAAVPMEAYDTDMFTSNMVDSAWSNVPVQYRASDWSSLFATNDFRSSLSWCGRFAGIQNAVNCYSETEDVLANPAPHGLGGAWSKQELFKGTTVWHGLNAIPFLGLDVACEGGWGINATYAVNPYYYVPAYGFFANAMSNFTREEAIESPLFTPFKAETAIMHSTNLFVIADADYRRNLRAKFLGDAIPATSFAAGANHMQRWPDERNINYADCILEPWPRAGRQWRHSDIKNIAYKYVHALFLKITRGYPK